MTRIKNYITTITGLLVIIFGGVLIWFDKLEPLWFIAFVSFGLVLVCQKDPQWLKKIVNKILLK